MLDNGHPNDADVSRVLNEHYENVEMNESYRRELLAGMLDAAASRRRRFAPRQWLIGAATAAAFVLVYLGAAHLIAARAHAVRLLAVTELRAPVTDSSGHKLEVGDYVAAGVVVRTGRGGRITLVARNGSFIHLDANSELMVDARGIAVMSKGRLYCGNRLHEINRIETPAGSIRLLGTVLDASLINNDTAAVTVVKGRVRLSNSHGEGIVTAGNRAIMVASQSPDEGSPVNTAEETAWYDGRNRIESDIGEIAYLVNRRKGMPRKERYAIEEFWAMKSDGSDKHLVTAFVGKSNYLGDWFPGGQWIVMQGMGPQNMTDPSRPSMTKLLRIVNALTGQDTYLPLPRDFSADSAAVSPDGKWMAINGAREQRNSWLLGKIPAGVLLAEKGIWIYNIESNELKPLLTGSKQKYVGSPAWSPDSRWLAVDEFKGNYNPHQIMLIDTQTGETRQLAEGYHPVFSPDGTKLAYCEATYLDEATYSGRKDATKSVCVIDVTGDGKPRRITAPIEDYISGPTWSPDGSEVAFHVSTHHGNAYIIRIAEADGSGMRDVYAAKGNIWGVSWGRDGKTLYISSHVYTLGAILKVAADGSGLIAYLGGNEDDSVPPDEVREQLAQARSVIADSRVRFWTGGLRMFQGRLNEGRSILREVARDLSELPWRYPLTHVSMPDVTTYADAATEFASLSNEKALFIACTVRTYICEIRLDWFCRGKKKLPPSIEDLRKAGGFGLGMMYGMPDSRIDGLTCPGKYQSKPVPYIYTPPKDGEPKIGDVIFQCPNHPRHRIVWTKYSERERNRPVPKLPKKK